MKTLLLTFLFFVSAHSSFSQYIAVKAKYTETRLVDDSPNPSKRENHLILNFFEVSPAGQYSVANLSNYDCWVHVGLQYGNLMGGVLDSTGNNYSGYPWPAPKAVSYYNTLGLNYVDCSSSAATHYVVNGNTLDVGWISVSYWDIDYGTGQPIECFPAPNISLPYYQWPDPYYYSPGNLNFDWSVLFPGPPYNMYNFSCGGSLQLVMRGVLGGDSVIVSDPLPVLFAFARGEIQISNTAKISWSNLTESDILRYEVQKADSNNVFISIDNVLPKKNNADRADYDFFIGQSEKTALYRIKAVELSGKIIYSTIIRLNLPDADGSTPDNSTLSVYPNPITNNQISYRLSNAEPGRYISCVVTPDGRQIKQKMIEHTGGDLFRQVELDPMPAGIYRLVVRSTQQKYSQPFFYGY